MAFILQRLNVVKTVQSEKQRDALLAKGFQLVEPEEKKSSVKKSKADEKTGAESVKLDKKADTDSVKLDEQTSGDT